MTDVKMMWTSVVTGICALIIYSVIEKEFIIFVYYLMSSQIYCGLNQATYPQR